VERDQLLHQAQRLQYARLVVELAVITPTELHQHVDQEHLEDRVVAKEQLFLEPLDPLQEQEPLVKVMMVEQGKELQVLLLTQVEVAEENLLLEEMHPQLMLQEPEEQV
jgi:hypothetical protein